MYYYAKPITMKKLLYSTILFFQIHFTFSQVVINEVMVKPGTDATSSVFQTLFSCTQPTQGNEYIELYNSDPCNAVDISCWILATPFNGISASSEGSIRFPAGTTIPPLGFLSVGGPASGATINLASLCPSSTTGNIITGGSRWYLDNLDSYIALYNSTGTPVDVVYWTLVANAANRWNNPTYDALVNAPTKITNPVGCSAITSLAGPATLPLSIVSYAGQAPSMGTVIERTTDGGTTWSTNSVPTINNCNGACLTSSAFDLNATIVQPSCGNNDGSISFAPSPASTYFYSWPFPSSSTVSSQTGLSPGTYAITISNSTGCSIDTSIILVDVPCGNVCDPTGNLVIYSNYDGGILTINVDQNIPNLKVGICTYEPIQVNFTGPFVGNITQVIYAGMNSNQNNNNCGLGNFSTSVTGVPAGIVTISPPMNPPPVGYTPAHGNGSGPWGGGVIGVAGLCDTTINAGGGNTPDEVVYYFLNATSGTLLYHQTQYNCWVNETLTISAGGNCCILPPNNNPCPAVTAASSQINVTCNGGSDGSATVVASGGTTFTYAWAPSGGSNATASGLTAGNYTCTITNECGNSTTQTVTITETVSYQLNATVIQPTCGNNNGCIYFDPSPAGTYFYDWPFPTVMIVDSICELAPGSYNITINSAVGCPIDTTIILANSNAATIDANPEISTINVGDSVQLNATGGVSYTWNPSSSLTCFDCPDPTAQPSQNTTYIVNGTDTDGCTGSDTVVVNVLPLPQPNFEFPNVITPNSDGANDVFEIENLPKNTEVIILNRWGNLVYSSANYQNNWDGKDTSGKELADGVYTYKFTTETGTIGHGFLHLVR